MKKRILTLDFDDLLLDTLPAILEFHNKEYGTSCRKEDMTSQFIYPLWGVSWEESQRRIREFLTTEYFFNAKPVEGAVEGVRDLANRYELQVVTSRHSFLEDITRKTIDRYFPAIKEAHFAHNWASTDEENAGKKKKPELCLEIGAECHVDDHLEYAKGCAEKGLKGIVFNQPWNRQSSPYVVRAYSWPDLVRTIDNLLR